MQGGYTALGECMQLSRSCRQDMAAYNPLIRVQPAHCVKAAAENWCPLKKGSFGGEVLALKQGGLSEKKALLVAAANKGISIVTSAALPSSSRSVALPTVLVAEKLGEGGLELLRKVANVDYSYNLTPEDLYAKISLCDALIVRSGTKVTREMFEASKGRLKVVGRAGVGIDNVDLQAATEFGCLVVNAPTANTIAAAEHGIALLVAMARNIPQADNALKAGSTHPRDKIALSSMELEPAISQEEHG